MDKMKIAMTVDASVKLSEPDWVMGESGVKNVTQTANDISKMQDRYYRDYADNWRALVHSVTVKTYKNRKEAADALQSISSASSPMKIFLIEVNKNTFLSAKPEVQGWWDWIKSFLPSGTKIADDSNTQPEKEFRPLQQFIG